MVRIASRGTDQFMVRFPDGMRDRIREEAEKNGRSMNAEIIQRLQRTLDYEDYAATESSFEDILGPSEPTHRDISDEELLEAIMRDMQSTTLEFAKKIKEQTERIKRHK